MKLRDLILGLMPPRLRADAEADSRRWIAACPACRAGLAIWDIGGVRYKASGHARSSLARCPHCRRSGFMRFQKRT